MRALSITFCLILVLIAAGLLFKLSDLVPYAGSDAYFRQPAFFPSVMLGLTLLTGLGLAAKYAWGHGLPQDEELSGTPPHLAVLVPLVVVFALYALAVPVLGYPLASLAFALASLAAGQHLRKGSALALILLALVLYLTFVVYLDVWFRSGDFPFLDWLS